MRDGNADANIQPDGDGHAERHQDGDIHTDTDSFNNACVTHTDGRRNYNGVVDCYALGNVFAHGGGDDHCVQYGHADCGDNANFYGLKDAYGGLQDAVRVSL